jgi:phenylalanyl-tRNA synthetase beta chain
VKLPLSWLTALVDIDLPVDQLVDVMSLHGLEVEDVRTPGAGTAGVRTAQVLAWEPHPDADKLRVVRVTGDGGAGEIELVCGANNFDVGDVVAHAVPGSAIPSPDGGPSPFQLEARTIRGIVSNGMLASARELQLGDDHAGILRLPAGTPLGAELTELLPLGEPVIEVAVQADRGDHLSVLGVARDLAAILDTTWRAPEVPDPLTAPTIPVTLETDACSRFVTWAVEDVTVQPSPAWLVQRLGQCGVRAIDLVVDVTNYVMLELGQPLHAFDLDQLRGPRLTVRRATEGESLTTLDEQVRALVAGDLVIDDAERAVSLAGVMGGRDTEVTATTRRVLVEAAVWEPAAIRATSRRLGLVSEASQRFERGVDPAGADRAAARAAGLLAELGEARPIGADAVAHEPVPAWSHRDRVHVDTARVRALLALDLDAAQQAALLERAGAEVTVDGDRLEVQPPTWRGDLTREADIAEEVVRLHGYDQVPTTLPRIGVTGGLTPAQRAERAARSAALALGFHEARTRPFVGEDALLAVVPSEGRVELANPLAKDAAALRPSLVEGLLQALRRNVGQGRAGTALVELGRLFRPSDDPLAQVLDEVVEGDWRWRAPSGAELPVQPRVVALAAQGVRLGDGWLDPDDRWGVEDLLAVLDEVVARVAPPDDPTWALERVAVERPGLHPGRTAALLLRGAEIGLVGQLHPDEADRRDLPEPVVVGELLLEPFLAATPADGHPPVRAAVLTRHPAMTVDVALVAPDDVAYATLFAAVRDGAGELLDDAWWFDEYRGEQVGEGNRSIAIRLRLQSAERQLTDDDAETVIAAVAAAAERVGATLRR